VGKPCYPPDSPEVVAAGAVEFAATVEESAARADYGVQEGYDVNSTSAHDKPREDPDLVERALYLQEFAAKSGLTPDEVIRRGVSFLDSEMPQHLVPYAYKKSVMGPSVRGPKIISGAYRKILRAIEPRTGLTFAELCAITVLQQAVVKGDVRAVTEIREAVEGKAKQPIELSGTISLDGELNLNIEDASDDQLEELIASYQARPKDPKVLEMPA
jgi:hypothetical protein